MRKQTKTTNPVLGPDFSKKSGPWTVFFEKQRSLDRIFFKSGHGTGFVQKNGPMTGFVEKTVLGLDFLKKTAGPRRVTGVTVTPGGGGGGGGV